MFIQVNSLSHSCLKVFCIPKRGPDHNTKKMGSTILPVLSGSCLSNVAPTAGLACYTSSILNHLSKEASVIIWDGKGETDHNCMATVKLMLRPPSP